MANKNIRSLSGRKGLKDNLFEKISKLSHDGATAEEFHELSQRFHLDDSVAYGTSSFYDFTKEEGRNRKIRICNGTACMVAGTQDKLHEWVRNSFKEEEIGHVACVGHCHRNSALLYNDHTHSIDSEAQLRELAQETSGKSYDPIGYRVGTNTTAILSAEVADHAAYFKRAKILARDKDSVLENLKRSGLRGRGGAGFPFWFKLDAVSKEADPEKYVVCNADEGDPGAYSDMYLLEHQAIKVLSGMYIAGMSAGATQGVLYIRGKYPNSIRTIEQVIAELEDQKLLGEFEFKIIRGQGSYVCGEETALLNSIEGLRPEVRVRPPYPAQYGLYGKPTLLSNVETFANVQWIVENGGDQYASIGTSQSTGTKLISLDSHFESPGVYEVEMGTDLKEVVYHIGKGFKEEIKAIQVGGPLGGIVPMEKIEELQLDFESFDKAGFLLGHASFVCIPKDFPIIRFLEHLLQFTAEESCGKCYPCRIGSHRGFEMLKKARTEGYMIDRQLLDDLIETLEIGSLCALGGGVPLPIKNALEYFDAELRQYFQS